MTPGQKFCTQCGKPLVLGAKFCEACGSPVSMPGAPTPQTAVPSWQAPVTMAGPVPSAAPQGSAESITGIVPFIEQGLLSVIHYTLVVTNRRLIFCTWNPDKDEAMEEADNNVMEESCEISETADEIAHFRAKDWSEGPWQRYRAMAPEGIAAGAPGSMMIPLDTIVTVNIICETKNSTQDSLHIWDGKGEKKFDLMYSQGPCLFRLLQPLLGERVEIADQLHRRHGLDRLLSGQEYK